MRCQCKILFSAAIPLGATRVTVMTVINTFAHTVVAEAYALTRQTDTLSCLHSLNTFQVFSYQ